MANEQCIAIKADGTRCKSYSMNDSSYCVFHSGAIMGRNSKMDLSKAIIGRKKPRRTYRYYLGKKIGEVPRIQRLKELEKFYDDGGLIATAIDSYVSVAVANGYQFLDVITGDRNTSATKILDELDARVNYHEMFVKIFRSILIYGFCWGEKIIEGDKIVGLTFLAPYEIAIERKPKGKITEFTQVRSGSVLAKWSGKTLDDVFFITASKKHSELYPVGLLERAYNESKAWKDQGADLGAVTKFVSYPFRIVKVGNDVYPASEAAVEKVGDEVQKLDPGDWLATRHNLEFEFHAPEVPDALVAQYKEKTRQLIVSLGVPSMYTALEEVDANTLKEIRDIFNSTVRTLQKTVIEQVSRQIFKKEFELKNKLKKRTDKLPAQLTWNPLTVAVLSILELTQLVTTGVVGLEEARRILESMGYGLLRGDAWRDDLAPVAEAPLLAPKESHPTSDDPDKKPTKPPTKDTDRPPTKKPSNDPKIKKPQPNAPKMSYSDWLAGIEQLTKIDKFAAFKLLKNKLENAEISA